MNIKIKLRNPLVIETTIGGYSKDKIRADYAQKLDRVTRARNQVAAALEALARRVAK